MCSLHHLPTWSKMLIANFEYVFECDENECKQLHNISVPTKQRSKIKVQCYQV